MDTQEICPYCNGTEAKVEDDFNRNWNGLKLQSKKSKTVTRSLFCEECNAFWTEEYKLIRIKRGK